MTTFSERQRLAFRDFKRRANERAQREHDAEADFKDRTAALEKEHQDALRRIDIFFAETEASARSEAEDSRLRLSLHCESAIRQAQQDPEQEQPVLRCGGDLV